MKIPSIRDPNFKQKRVLWIYICLFCLIPFLINSKEAKEPEIVPKLDPGSKVQVEIAPKLDPGSKVHVPSVSSSPSGIKSKKRLGYRHYSYSSSFGGSGLGDGFFDRPVAISVDSQNNIYVVDQGNNLIQKFDQNGEFLDQWSKWGDGDIKGIRPKEFDGPSATAVTMDDEDNLCIYIVDTNNNRILKFVFWKDWKDAGDKDNLPKPCDRIDSLQTDKEEVNVSVFAYGSMGAGEGQFQRPVDIVVDKDNYIYVLDAGNHRIQKIDWRNKNWRGEKIDEFVDEWKKEIESESKLSIVYQNKWEKLPIEFKKKWKNIVGEDKEEWGSYGSCRECFLDPLSFAYDTTGFGYLYVLDKQRQGFILHKIDMDGRFVKNLDVFHNTECPITQPIDIYIDDDGFLYIIDQATSAVCKFNTDGEFIQKIGGESPSKDKDATLKKPYAIIMDSDKRLLIVDLDDSLIKIFDQI